MDLMKERARTVAGMGPGGLIWSLVQIPADVRNGPCAGPSWLQDEKDLI
jgi:hypothetical protein